MTRRELSQLYYLRREINSDRERLAKLEAAATSTSPSNGGGGGSGTPSCRKGNWSDRTSLAVEIAALKDLIYEKICREEKELLRLMNYISGVEDSLTRQILTARFVDNLSWVAIAVRVGGGNTPEMVRKRCYRFLRDN